MLRRLPLLPFSVGLAAVYIAERSLNEIARWVVLAIGAVLLALGLGLALARLWRAWASSPNDGRKAAAAAVRSYVLCVAALGLYAFQAAFLEGAEHATARTVLTVVWPLLLLLGLGPALAIELALASMAQSPVLELWRVRLAGRAARVVVYAVIVFAGANYAASQWNRKLDLSYFRTTEPSGPTLNLVKSLSEPVRVVLFAPPGNEVMDEAHDYLAALAAAGPQLKLEVVDQALVPDLAREMKVRQNGVVAIAKGGRTETIQIGLDREAARAPLRRLDGDVQERLLKVARPPRTIYLTTGHMERDYYASSSDNRLGFDDFRALAESIGFTVKRLGLGEGLGTEVPKDAGVVVIAGPTEPFLPAERNALRAYLDRGGRLLALIDPDTGVTEDELLAPLGVRVTKTLVASERTTVRLEGRGDSPYNFATTRVTSHPSVLTDSQNSGRVALVFLGAGAVEKRDDAPGDLRQTFTVQAMMDAWADTNHNGTFDPATEKRATLSLVAAIERTPKPSDNTKAPARGATAEKPGEKAAAKATDKADKGAQSPAAKGADKPATAAKPAPEPGGRNAGKPADKPDAKAAQSASAKSAHSDAKTKDAGQAASGDAAAPPPTVATPPMPMRAVVVGDADVFGNGILRNAGNAYLMLDSLKWLVGDEQLAGKTTSEEDVPLVHKRSDDAVWYYGVSFVVPAAVLAVGLLISRKSKKRRAP